MYTWKVFKKGHFIVTIVTRKKLHVQGYRMRKKMREVERANYRRGDEHPGAILSDAEVDLVRELHDAGWTYRELCDKFEVSKSAIAGYCQCRRRKA